MGKSREIMDELERANEEEDAIEFDRETGQFRPEVDVREVNAPHAQPDPVSEAVQLPQKFYD